ncbi:hypothetical protein [Novosphingobium sp.]|uniref:hypothetical protein n=1 Tax=Novosphingobium sp. TaxID=1874826 RepID=UPI002638718B|nr:hypothetical protein [Novosphingobium sp.]
MAAGETWVITGESRGMGLEFDRRVLAGLGCPDNGRFIDRMGETVARLPAVRSALSAGRTLLQPRHPVSPDLPS